MLSVQSYAAYALSAEDLLLLQDVAQVAALARSANRYRDARHADGISRTAEFEAPDGLLVLDAQGRLVRLKHAARRLLSLETAGLVLGYPVDRPQAGRWPLGTADLTEQLRPVREQLKRGENPGRQVAVTLPGGPGHLARCCASVLVRDGRLIGGVLLLHEITEPRTR